MAGMVGVAHLCELCLVDAFPCRYSFGTLVALVLSTLLRNLFPEVLLNPMVIIAMVGGLFAGGALFAILKNAGNRSSESKYTKLDIG